MHIEKINSVRQFIAKYENELHKKYYDTVFVLLFII